MVELELGGWAVVQDVHDLGEELGIYRLGWNDQAIEPAFSEWEPIDHLAHLQLLLAETPYFGRALRHFNEHPWWYRLEFQVPEGQRGRPACLRFEGADYFCKVWLNGQYVGAHEGYFAPFEFEVGHLLRPDGPQLLIVKVWSPWDTQVAPGLAQRRFSMVVRDMVKGTYEHADTFIQRDVNPVGLWRPVRLLFHPGVRFAGTPAVEATLAEGGHRAEVHIACPVQAGGGGQRVRLTCRILEERTGLAVAEAEASYLLAAGQAEVSLNTFVPEPRLWNTWDRGEPNLYRVAIRLTVEGEAPQTTEERFGVRQVEMRRSDAETAFYLNGRRIFVRGTSYFSDVYLSAVGRERYARDLAAVRRAGCNAVRVHVHVENPAFYDLCDEMGLAVIQDSDLNWMHPTDKAWKDRAVGVLGDMIRLLRNHPSIVAWVCLNEPKGMAQGDLLSRSPGPHLLAEARRLDPSRPTIAGSGAWDDPASGDLHDYAGSLAGEATHYAQMEVARAKLVTEFGFDAPPCVESLRCVPQVYRRLRSIAGDIPALQHYQYRLLKHYIEQYRMHKGRPCWGYFHFMLIDLCPQSFYGVYDWWGLPKEGLRALEESNQPVGIFVEYGAGPQALWVANDRPEAFPGCRAAWTVCGEEGELVAHGEVALDLPPDSIVRAADLAFPTAPEGRYRVSLTLHDAAGRMMAANVYDDPFHHPPHPEGHPQRMSHELGVRLYGA